MKQKNRRQSPAEICSFCGKQTARLYLKNHTFGHGSRLIVIENVPTYVCDNCRESYLTAETSRAIDEILAHPEQHTSPRQVNVATLAA
jgi:YgiT-type zinc finger domain-containing protein